MSNLFTPEESSLNELFGAKVIVVEAKITKDVPISLPEEELLIQKASSVRKNEFRAGRHCAHRALEILEKETVPILREPNERAPIWPQGIVGAISHTRECCAAALALEKDVRSVGLDIETRGRLKPHVWSLVLTAREQEWVLSQAKEIQEDLGVLFFCIKECFYKFQYPCTKEWLGFLDVEVQLDREKDQFEIKTISSKAAIDFLQRSYKGKYMFSERWVCAGMHL